MIVNFGAAASQFVAGGVVRMAARDAAPALATGARLSMEQIIALRASGEKPRIVGYRTIEKPRPVPVEEESKIPWTPIALAAALVGAGTFFMLRRRRLAPRRRASR